LGKPEKKDLNIPGAHFEGFGTKTFGPKGGLAKPGERGPFKFCKKVFEI